MDQRCYALALLTLISCGRAPEAHYRAGRELLNHGKVEEAMREASAGMRAEPSWRFRILEADVFLIRSDTKAARELLDFKPPPSDPESRARLSMDQSLLASMSSDYASAETLLTQARDLAKPLGLPALGALIENRMGSLQMRQGRPEEAERSLRHVIQVSEAARESNLHAIAMTNLGVLFLKSFRLEEAIYWLDKARQQFQQLGLTDYYYIALANLGSGYQSLGEFDRALANYQEAETHARQIGDRYSEQHWLGNSGEVLSERGDYRGAKEKFQQAIVIAQARDKDEKDLTGWWYYNLASLSIELGDFDAAQKYNQEALRLRQAIADRSDYYPRVNEALIAAGRHDLPRAEALYRSVISEFQEGMNPEQMLEAQAGLADLLAEKQEKEQADVQFRAALVQLESHRTALAKADYRMSYLAKLIRFYDRYINFLVDSGQPEKALEVAESSRARVLDERLQSESTPATAERTMVPGSRMRELARSSHTVFLSYWLGKKRSFLWAITPEGITLHELPPEDRIATLVSGYRSFLEDLRDPLQSEYPGGRQLSELLLAPVHTALATAQRVVIVPDRALHSLNFETLPDPADPTKYLIERTTLEIAPSLNMLASRHSPAIAGTSMLLIGNPEQAVEEYPRLPFAGTEMARISQVVAPGKQTLIEGAQAFPAAYRDAHPGDFAWIHFAAHAAANPVSPLDSALILSRQDNQYQLSAREVMSVPLRASLVTLSACRSAGAKTYSGEGQVGLSWAFLRAGSRAVVAGLWDVTDRSTASLMSDFYTQLAQNIPPAAALRHAKLAMLHGGKVYQKPFYWGPFQLYAGAL